VPATAVLWAVAVTPKAEDSARGLSTASGVPKAVSRPAVTIATSVANSAARLMSCSVDTIVSFSVCKSSRISSWWRMSRWLVGSSRMMMRGSWASARAISTRCFSPPESVENWRPARWARSRWESACCTRSRSVSVQPLSPSRRGMRPIITTSRTLKGKSPGIS